MRKQPRSRPAADPLGVIRSLPPRVPAGALESLLARDYGLEGELQELVSERDQTVRVTADDGRAFVIRIANPAEQPAVADFQIRALLHLERRACPVPTPRIVRTVAGTVATRLCIDGQEYRCRVVSYLPGRPLSDVALGVDLARAVGAAAATLDVALADFEHPGGRQPLLWDVQRATELRPLLRHLTDASLRASVGRAIDDFEASCLPALRASPRQVVHGDLNPDNVLVTGDAAAVAGVIDFGDMVHAPVIVEVAIAAAYMRAPGADPVALIEALVAGYGEVSRLAAGQIAQLYGLIRARLATSIAIMHWRLAERGPGDAYSRKSEQGEIETARLLRTLDDIEGPGFTRRMLAAASG